MVRISAPNQCRGSPYCSMPGCSGTQRKSFRTSSGGQPRIFYTLPYLASINAMAGRLGTSLGDENLIGVAHSRAALYHLDRSLRDDDVLLRVLLVSEACCARLPIPKRISSPLMH